MPLGFSAVQVPVFQAHAAGLAPALRREGSIVAATCNGAYQGRCAEIVVDGAMRPVGDLFFRDHERIEGQMALFSSLARTDGLSLIGGQEFFDTAYLEGVYHHTGIPGFPYACFGPSGGGIQAIVDHLIQSADLKKRMAGTLLSRNLESIVASCFQGHYEADGGAISWKGALKLFGTEDELIARFQQWLSVANDDGSLSPFTSMGSGLAIFSRHPILRSWFIPFEKRAEFERFLKKGILVADLSVAHDGKESIIRVINTHLQDVVSRESHEAQAAQAVIVRQVIDASPYPVVLLGDFNAEPGSKNYKTIFRENLRNCHAHPLPPTFLKRNPIAQARGIHEKSTETDRCIDHIGSELSFGDFMGSGLGIFSQVLLNPHSDHCLVLALILLKEEMQASGARRIRPSHDQDPLIKIVAA